MLRNNISITSENALYKGLKLYDGNPELRPVLKENLFNVLHGKGNSLLAISIASGILRTKPIPHDISGGIQLVDDHFEHIIQKQAMLKNSNVD